ncbi:unnamed protein product [Penicillium egyptiacum]|uniref:Alpha/beta hydrolase fold-3 domain-containing protein n=1 Tax=Penicillium egyptiacum TaxID=1303716 RepID=A0A9W4K3U6_9EURO|nr:unnamed protein product [Penicillium egyptiacum]
MSLADMSNRVRTPPSYDRDYSRAVVSLLPACTGKLAPDDALSIRSRETALWEKLLESQSQPESPDVDHTVHTIPSYDGQTITIHRFSKKITDNPKSGPAIVHAHGGGMITGSVNWFQKYIVDMVQRTGVQIFSVEYRLSPEHPFPTPAEDCYAGLVWAHEHAEQFAIDRRRIGTMGESAGGNLAASITLMARDRGLLPPIAKQILVYPMLDDRNIVHNSALNPLLTWTTESNIIAWSAYLGDLYGTDRVPQYAAPSRSDIVEGLPPTYIEVGTLDIFRDEALDYAARIAEVNIEVELHVYPGLPHGFDFSAPLCGPTQRALADRERAISTL